MQLNLFELELKYIYKQNLNNSIIITNIKIRL